MNFLSRTIARSGKECQAEMKNYAKEIIRLHIFALLYTIKG